MAKLQLNNTDVIEQVSSTDVTYKFPGPNHTFSVKAVNQPITGATNSTNDDANSDQLAIYNGSTKLWGISEAGYVVQPKNPVFQAYGTLNSPTTGNYMIFPTTVTNIGNHYDTTNGKFTAPISGNYIFATATIGNNTVSTERLYFHKNGSQYISDLHLRVQNDGTWYPFGERSFIVVMSAGDYFQIYNGGAGTLYPGTTDNDNAYLSLSGYFLG